MNWLKKLFGFKQQSPKEAKKEPKKSISSGATIGGYSSAYRGFDFPSSNDNDHYNPLSPTSPFFYGQNHEESEPAPNQEQHHDSNTGNSRCSHHHDTGASHSHDSVDDIIWEEAIIHDTSASHLHDYPSSPSDTVSYDSGCTDNNSSVSDY